MASSSLAIEGVDAAAPPIPEWALPYMGKLIRQQVPTIGRCQGNSEFVTRRFIGVPTGVEMVGWGWDLDGKRRVDRVLVVDTDARIVGAGEGGRPRPDVPRVNPGFGPDTGWVVIAHRATGPLDVYGLTAGGRESCSLGRLEF